MLVLGKGDLKKKDTVTAVSPEYSSVSMKGGIIQNKWIIWETGINDSIKVLSRQTATGGQHD